MILDKQFQFFTTDENMLKGADTVDDVDKLIEQMKTPPTADTETPVEQPTTETETPQGEKAEGQESSEQPVEVAPVEDTAKKDTLLVTDEFLSGLDENDRRTLEKYKGKPLEELAKALVNSQKQIGKLSSEKQKEAKEQFFQKKQPEPEPVKNTGEYKEKLLLKAVRDLIPEGVELPPNLDIKSKEFREWLTNFTIQDRLASDEFIETLRGEAKAIDEAARQAEYIEQNYEPILAKQMNEAVKGISDYAERIGISLKDFGYDFTPDANGDIKAIDELLFPEGQIDNSLVQYLYGEKPLLNPDAIAKKFYMEKLPEIMAKKAENDRKEAYKTQVEKKQEKLPPSLGINPPQKKELTKNDVASYNSIDSIDAAIREMKAAQ